MSAVLGALHQTHWQCKGRSFWYNDKYTARMAISTSILLPAGATIMPRFIKTFLFTGIPFGLFMSVFNVFYALLIPWSATLFITIALGSGIVFGLCMAAIVSSKRIKKSATPHFSADEQILKASPANHFAGEIAMGGWLFLTNQRLIFQAHALLQESYELSLSLTDIVQAQPSMTAWIIPNGLTIRTRQGQIERFVIEHRRQWGDVLRTVCAERSHDNA